MLYLRRIRFILTLLLFVTTISAQNPFYKILGLSAGFPCSTVYDVYQSKNGLIWLATDVGLFSYDGFDIRNQENTYHSDKAVTNILEDNSGRIWCQTFKGIFYYTQGDSLVMEQSISNSHRFYAAQMLNGNTIATVTDSGVTFFDTKTKKKKVVRIPRLNVIIPTCSDQERFVLNAIQEHAQYTIRESGTVTKKKLSQLNGTAYTTRFNNQLVTITKEYPYRIILENDSVIHLPLENNSHFYINNIKAISKNRLALCTSSGLYLLDKHYNIINRNGYYTDVNVSGMIEDTEGNYWLSSINKGLVFTNQFNIILNSPDYVFLTVCHSKDALYFGTQENTVIKMDFKTKSFDTIYHFPIKQNIAHVLYNDRRNELVFSNMQFNVMNLQTKAVKSLWLKVNAIDRLDDSHYILAHGSGLSIYPNDNSALVTKWRNNQSVVSENAISIHVRAEPHYHVKCIHDRIYFSTAGGLFEYSAKGIKPIRYQKTPLNINNLGVINNELIVITYNAGVLRYSNGQLVPLFDQKNGMGKSDVYLGKTFENKLYVLLYDGMHCYDPATSQHYSVNMTDGVESDLADFTVLHDTIHATNYEGFLSFKLDSTLATKTKPRIILNAFCVNDLPMDTLVNQRFAYNQNNIKINYSLIDYRGRKYTKVFYKLNNGNWIETNPKLKELLFTALEPNAYMLQLKAVNYRGYQSNIIKLKFVIQPPFYKTWWFMALMGLLIAAIIVFIALYRIRILKDMQAKELERQKLLHEVDLSNIRSLRAQMNPHFLYNALNAIQSYIYTGNKETAVASLGIFSDLSRGVLESSRNKEISLFDEMALIENYLKLEVMRLPKIRYQITVDQNLNLHDTYIPTMIIQPLVENAVYHGLSNKRGEGTLTIQFILAHNMLEVVIQDDGIGRSAASKLRQRALKKSASFSTSANLSRIDLLNANKEHKITLTMTDLYSENGEASGTKVILIIPINDND